MLITIYRVFHNYYHTLIYYQFSKNKINYLHYLPVVNLRNGDDFAENVGKPLRLNKIELVETLSIVVVVQHHPTLV